MVDEYSDVTRILRAVEARYRSRTVFISGSAHVFDPWQPDTAGRFVESLSAELIRKGFNVVTGFGLGVGPSVIAGALQEILTYPKRHSQSQLQAFPFPVDDGSAPKRRALYRRHRETMIGKAGIAIFLFGNKRDDRGRIVAADGMREGYSIVQALGLSVIAVGATGWVAQAISRDLVGKISGRSGRPFRKLAELQMIQPPILTRWLRQL